MERAEFNEVVINQIKICTDLLGVKDQQYGVISDGDRLSQFKGAGSLRHVSQRRGLSGMMSKHTTCLYDLIESESNDAHHLQEVINDHINYLLLLKGILVEEGVLSK
jgi:hypothetical protein